MGKPLNENSDLPTHTQQQKRSQSNHNHLFLSFLPLSVYSSVMLHIQVVNACDKLTMRAAATSAFALPLPSSPVTQLFSLPKPGRIKIRALQYKYYYIPSTPISFFPKYT
jgi:hypothetical protein